MPDALLPASKSRPFEINKPHPQGKAIARLPTLGMGESTHPLLRSVGVDGVDSYHAMLHAVMGDLHDTSTSLDVAAKALGATPPQAMAYARMAFMPDPANAGLMQWPGMQPESLRKVARENLLPRMMIQSRIDDLRRYSCLATHPWSPGWEIGLRDGKETPGRQDRSDIKEAERFIWNCSMEEQYLDPRVRDAHHISQFESFLCAAVDDSLTFDGWSIWHDRDVRGRIRSFANMPAGMVRLALPNKGYKGNPTLYAALVDDTGTPVASFTRDDMTWCVRNVRNDPNVVGYGWSEIEMAIRVIQGFAGAIDLNVSTFDKNGIPNGILLLKGDFWQQDQIDALQKEWVNMKRGVSKVWGLPVLAVPEDGDVEMMNFMDLKGEEIRYKDHINLMAGVYCIITQFPIRRWGMFASGNRRDNAPVQDGSVELQGADDPGLPAMLTFMEHRINEYLLWPNWKDLQFRFRSKNPKEDARAYEARKLARTMKESRAEADLQELPKGAPDWIEPVLEIMQYCPEDSSKTAVFQALALVALEKKLGVGDEGEGGEANATPGAPYPSKVDPAQSQAHGHRAGVRRSGKAERASAGVES